MQCRDTVSCVTYPRWVSYRGIGPGRSRRPWNRPRVGEGLTSARTVRPNRATVGGIGLARRPFDRFVLRDRASVAGRELVGRRDGLPRLGRAVDEGDLVVLVEHDRGGVTSAWLAVDVYAHRLGVGRAQATDVVGRQAHSPFREE